MRNGRQTEYSGTRNQGKSKKGKKRDAKFEQKKELHLKINAAPRISRHDIGLNGRKKKM